jgi:DNA-binding PadR family transcriptional regulator
MSLRIAALGLLAQHPGSGYDLLKRFDETMGNVWPATQSQLYGELNKLADSGLIEITDVGPRGRKEYQVTESGHAEMLRWLASPQNDPPYRNARLLRVFLLSELPSDQARAYLSTLADGAKADLERFEELRDSIDRHLADKQDDSDFFARAALEYGLRVRAVEAEWARWAADALEARSKK